MGKTRDWSLGRSKPKYAGHCRSVRKWRTGCSRVWAPAGRDASSPHGANLHPIAASAKSTGLTLRPLAPPTVAHPVRFAVRDEEAS